MNKLTISRRLQLAFGALTIMCLCSGIVSTVAMTRAATSVMPIKERYDPLRNTAEEFERQILNARIGFIYYVTIQKPRVEGKRTAEL